MSKLQNARKSAGLSQSKLAEISGVGIRMIQDYEQGHKDINGARAITVYNLAQALGVTIECLLEIE